MKNARVRIYDERKRACFFATFCGIWGGTKVADDAIFRQNDENPEAVVASRFFVGGR